MTDAAATAARAWDETRRAGRWLFAAIVVLLCAWVLLPIYLLLVNALSAPEEVTALPEALLAVVRLRLGLVLPELPGRARARSGTRCRWRR